jgi:GNAT superfamily N-acetyltransferase
MRETRVPSLNSVRIERARDSDIAALIELLATLFAIEKDFAPDRVRQRRGLELLLRQPVDRAVLLVARSTDGAAIGMASAQLVISTAEGAPSAWIEDVVVHHSVRGRGIARLLLQELLIWAQRRGATRAQLLADDTSPPALGFYRHIGWQSTQLSAWRRSLQQN